MKRFLISYKSILFSFIKSAHSDLFKIFLKFVHFIKNYENVDVGLLVFYLTKEAANKNDGNVL